jgi:hypothetical protein
MLIVFVSLHTLAQKKAAFGLKGGVNIANLKIGDFETVNNYHTRTSFHLGSLAHIHLNQQLALQPELFFSGQGTKYKSNYQMDDVPDVAYDWHLNYLNVPVLLQYLPCKGFRVETGPQVGLLLSAKSKDKYDEQDIKENLKGGDFSWVFGAGYATKLGLGMDIRYNLGVADINKNLVLSAKNKVFQIGLFYLFKENKK